MADGPSNKLVKRPDDALVRKAVGLKEASPG